MKIAVELRQITIGPSGGLTSLLKEVLETAFLLYPQHDFLVFATIYNRRLLGPSPDNVSIRTLPANRFWAEVDRLCKEDEVDVLFRTYPMEDDLAFPLSRQVFLIPDIQHEAWPAFFAAPVLRSRRAAFNLALSRAGAIGTISEHARQTLRDHEWTRCPDVFVMLPSLPAGCGSRPWESLSAEERLRIPGKRFFLYPANLWPHKNHGRILEAFSLLLKEAPGEIELLLTGHPQGWDEIQARFSGLPVRHLGFVRPPLLRALFERAAALVFFSLYEGFGMPLLEAFDAGTPVICSNTTSLPEVRADAVLACDPQDVEAMCSLMSRILGDDALRTRLVAAGRKRLEEFSWERAAHSLVEACTRVRSVARVEGRPVSAAVLGPPLVSIVTPSFNQGRFLRRTIDSVLGQRYPHIEHIVMDGASGDDSVEVLRSYGQRFLWVSEPDKGQADAINRGLALSHGDIRAYLNSDDVLLPDAVEKAVAHLQASPECDLVYGRAHYVDEEGRVTGQYNTAVYSFDRLMEDCCICQPAAFWRSRIAKRVGPFDDALDYVMDYDYWLRIDRAGGCIQHIPDVLACSRRYPGTKTSSARARIYEEIFKVCQKHGGRVDRSYFQGLWHHRIDEGTGFWPRLLRNVPPAFSVLGSAHHSWYHRRQIREEALLRFKRGVWGPWSRRRMYGLWSDNWLGPACQVPLGRQTAWEGFHLGGVPSVDTTLTVRTPRRVIAARRLRGGHYERMDFQVDTTSTESVMLRFSKYVIDSARRRVSFLVQDTNLFAEHDSP